ncbi:MAG: CIA30 family protein [Spirochaetota bacterium]
MIFKKGIVLILLAVVQCSAPDEPEKKKTYFPIDDFSLRTSSIGQKWQGVTDSVLGNVSTVRLSYNEENGDGYLRIRGHVSMKHRRGFVQCRLYLSPQRDTVDFSEFTGIRLTARKNKKSSKSGYYVHLRTRRTVFPWSYYYAPFTLTEDWQVIDIPFDGFSPAGMILKTTLSTEALRSIALAAVAGKSDSYMDFSVTEIGFY